MILRRWFLAPGLLLALLPEAAPASPGSRPASLQLVLADGVPMSYVDRGAGEPALVFVHCGNCRKEIWTETLDALAGSHRVVAMDLPGHGDSGAARAKWSIQALGEDVAALVRHLDLRRVVLVGNSLGGPVSLHAAGALGRQRVAGVIAVDTLHDLEWRWPEESWKRQLTEYRRDFPAACHALMMKLVPRSSPEATRTRIDGETCGNDPPAAIALLESMRSFDAAKAAQEAAVPLRAINSAGFPTAVETNRRHVPDFDVILMEGVGHYPQVERPGEFQEHLRKTIASLAAR
ncbi:MAG TPA: alpha/beta hydrolase [Candidatus Polarisedimenticolia bacterium]|nr:alpha/beta hydrolase [Candidatus Polarisedimenticolia bacterium]